MNDLFGKAILDYQTGNAPEDLITETDISEPDEMPVAYLFRDFNEMPVIEQTALRLAKGRVLDIGCGAGSHSLYLQNKRQLDVTAVDVSEGAIETCRLRGVRKTRLVDVMQLEYEQFDTLLLLMNGTGIFGTMARVASSLQQLKKRLSPNGQILIDSSDILYMFDTDEEGAHWIPADRYYGELTFTVSYKGQTDPPFPWLYLDFNTLQTAAHHNGLACELLTEGPHHDYLARLTIMPS